uniref:Endonuclease/exonuclease/phosphatase domain-containing protein n=1 Tax=Peronospora matthiolae TaxID=2874970 RepID=A0AAV1UJ36_9STRA
MHIASLLAASLVAFTFIDGHSSIRVAAASIVRVMSFNVRTSNAPDPCPSGCWLQRKERFGMLLEKHPADLICTQEGTPEQIEHFRTKLGFSYVGLCAGNCSANERNAIMYKPDRLQLLWSKTFALSDTPYVLPSNSWGHEYLRAAVVARFLDPQSQHVICILNTHFDVSIGHNESAVLVARLLHSYCQPQDDVFMTGDLNTVPETAAVQYLLGNAQFNGSFTQLPLYETLTAVGQSGFTFIGPDFDNRTNSAKIDYIFARKENKTCLRSGEILTDLFNGYSVSDHAVVLSEFCLGDGCTNCVK